MVRPRVIPILLMNKSGLIKTVQYSQAKYVGDPINAVKVFNEKEVDELIILDIYAWREREINFKRLKDVARQARMPLCYGGGIESVSTAEDVIRVGYEKVSLGRAAILDRYLVTRVAERIGSQSVVVSVDVKTSAEEYQVMMQNGKKKLHINLFVLCRELETAGAGEIVLNVVDKEGTMVGYDIALAEMVCRNVKIPVTINGGCGSVEHMQSLVENVGLIGLGVGSFFTFKGPFRAVMISYNKPEFK